MNNKNNKFNISKLPFKTPVILDNSFFLLPLNEASFILNKKYLTDLIDLSFKSYNRYIAVLGDDSARKSNKAIATLAKIISFTELSKGKYKITLKAIIRFNINEIVYHNDIAIAYTSYFGFTQDITEKKLKLSVRKNINDIAMKYLSIVEKSDLNNVNILDIPDDKLLSILSNHLSFTNKDKQELIAARDLNEIVYIISNLLEYKIATSESQNAAKH